MEDMNGSAKSKQTGIVMLPDEDELFSFWQGLTEDNEFDLSEWEPFECKDVLAHKDEPRCLSSLQGKDPLPSTSKTTNPLGAIIRQVSDTSESEEHHYLSESDHGHEENTLTIHSKRFKVSREEVGKRKSRVNLVENRLKSFLLNSSGVKAVQTATISSRPANLSNLLAEAVRCSRGRQASPEHLISTKFWILPSLLREQYRARILEEVDRYGPFMAVQTQRKAIRIVKSRENSLVKDGDSSHLSESMKTSLLEFAKAIALEDQGKIRTLKHALISFSNARGSWLQRLICYFMEGLSARMRGENLQDFVAPIPTKRTDLHLISEMYTKVPHLIFMTDCTNDIIANATAGADIIHIVDLSCWSNHWESLFRSFSETSGRPPTIRFTAVEPPPGDPWPRGPCVPSSAMQKEVISLAAEYGLQCDFRGVISRLQDLNSELLRLEKGETLVVSAFHRLQFLPSDAPVMDSKSNPRDSFLRNVRSWRPRVFVTSHVEVDKNSPFFLQRIGNSLQFFSAIFETLEALAASNPRARLLVERSGWAREIVNSVACEGLNRIGREECHFQWRKRFLEAGFSEFTIHPQTVEGMKRKVKKCHIGFGLEEREKGLLLKWKETPTHALHAWTC